MLALIPSRIAAKVPFLLFTQSYAIFLSPKNTRIYRDICINGHSARLADPSRELGANGHVAKLADALALGASGEIHVGSTPAVPTKLAGWRNCVKGIVLIAGTGASMFSIILD